MLISLVILAKLCLLLKVYFSTRARLRSKILELQSKLDLQSKRAAEFAHEIKHPIAVIASTIDSIKTQTKDFLSNRDQLSLEQAGLESHNLAEQLQNFLLICFCESKELKSNPRSINLYDSVSAVVRLFDSQLKLKESKVNINLQDRSLSVFIDPLHLKQILFNLLHNSLEHAGEKLLIEIETERSSDKNQITVKFSDNGKGIDNVEEIFNSEFINSRKNSVKGTGIGLKLCKSLVEFYGGEIWAINRLVGGTTTYFTLSKSKDQNLMVSDAEKFSESKKVLILTDGNLKAKEIANEVESLGASVDAISDVITALQELSKNNYDAIIVDEHVDQDNGIELARLIDEELDLEETRKFVLLSVPNQQAEIYSLNSESIWPANKKIIKELLE